MQCYTVGIKRRILPGYKKFKVVNNWMEANVNGHSIEPRIVLKLTNGDELSIPGINKKTIKVYADYEYFKQTAHLEGPVVSLGLPDQKQLVEQYRAELMSRQPQFSQG